MKTICFLLFTLCMAIACRSLPKYEDSSVDAWGIASVSDPEASALTKTVFRNLLRLGSGGVKNGVRDVPLVFGQQEADVSTTTGNGTSEIQSDLKKVTKKFPALVSYELSHAYKSSKTMFDPNAFANGLKSFTPLVIKHKAAGVLVSFVWHMRCPKSTSEQNDQYNPEKCPMDYRLSEFLAKKPNGTKGMHYDEWMKMLDQLGDFLNSLKDPVTGELIPVQIRPFHEFTGNWFWWGIRSDGQTFQQVWREMVDHLRQQKKVHHVLWVFSPDKPTDTYLLKQGGKFEDFYPGDAYVDVVSFDRYDQQDSKFDEGYAADIAKIGKFAKDKGKIAAVSEIGIDLRKFASSKLANWYSQKMMAPLLTTPAGAGFSYVALWRNAPWETFVPTSQDTRLVGDILAIAERPDVLFAESGWNPYEDNNSTSVQAKGNQTNTTSGGVFPPCSMAAVDQDGDGWAFENNQSCQIVKCTPKAQRSSNPKWGFEKGQSCRF